MGIGGKIIWAMALAAQVGTFAAPGSKHKPSEATQLRVTVYVYNYAEVSAAVLAEAERAATKIYRRLGVEMKWLDCALSLDQFDKYPACQSNPGPNQLVLRTVSRSMMNGLQRHPSAFGLAAVPENGGFGYLALVCSECAEPLLERTRYSRGMILGNLMAHEIGHLLLNTMRHSSAGVMRARWNALDLKDAAQGQLDFNAKEAKQIRAQVQERMRPVEATRIAGFRPPPSAKMP